MSGSIRTGNRPIDARRLWAGGVVVALVAALVTIVCILIARGLVGVAILAPHSAGVWGDADTVTYVVLSAVGALVATGLMHVLWLTTPRPIRFFRWIMVLVTLIATVVPLAAPATMDDRVGTAMLNLVIGLVITGLVSGVASAARTPMARPSAQYYR